MENKNKKITVIGIATGSRDIESWYFNENDELCKKFCEQLAQETGYSVHVIEGEWIGKYSIEKPKVNFISEPSK